jgi:hypothetical protein
MSCRFLWGTHKNEKLDPDPHSSKSWIRIGIKVKSWNRIRIFKVKSWIWITIIVKSWIRIRTEVMRIQNPGTNYEIHKVSDQTASRTTLSGNVNGRH